jgi:NAD(P) transhydrogenase subunit alpha
MQDTLSPSATLANEADNLSAIAQQLSEQANKLAMDVTSYNFASGSGHESFVMMGLTIFVLACFVGYYVVWRVTPALHSPLMAITNAISSVIIVGALIAAGPADFTFSKIMGFIAVVLASINIFGGFIVTRRMLAMFKKKG